MAQQTVINISIALIALAFAYAGFVSARAWLSGRARSMRWIAFAMFGLAAVYFAFTFWTFDTTHANRHVLWVATFGVLTFSQWCLLRFSLELAGGQHRRLRIVGDVLFGVAAALQLVIPDRIAFGKIEASAAQLLVHSSMAVATFYGMAVSATVLWRAGRGMPSIVRNRLRLLAIAMVVFQIAMTGSGIRDYPIVLVFSLMQVGSILLLVFAAIPPRWLRNAWQAPLLRRMLGELAEVSAMTDPEAVRARLLPTIARAASAQRAVMLDANSGEQLEVYGSAGATDVRRVHVPSTTIDLELVGAPHDPFFGIEERQLVQDLGMHLQVALERCSLLERERETVNSVSAANEQLMGQNAQLSELAELRDAFVAIASHELRTPITTIMGFTQTLLDLWGDIDDAERLRYLELVDRDSRRLGQLVADLLLLSSVEAADFHVARRRVDLIDLFEDVRADLGRDGALFQVKLEGDDLAVQADPRHVRQVFVNLLANAIKHGAPPFHVRARATDDYKVLIEVIDAGPGVPDEFRERLFGRFSRAEQSAAVPGSGLGLFIVRRLVEVQGGRVWLQDGREIGSCFSVELPAAAPALVN